MNIVSANNRCLWKSAGLLACILGMLAAQPAPAQSLQITTVAGYAGKGSNDGVASSALFNGLQGVAVDAGSNLYIADTGNNTIRIVTAAGVSSTVAGVPGVAGSSDGFGSSALFNQPSGLAIDHNINMYVTDYGNSTIRKVTLAGQVTTICGMAGVVGANNANGTNATFNHPLGIAVDASGNLYVADYGNDVIRVITTSFAVSTLAGSAGNFGFTNATGTSALFYEPEGVAVDQAGDVYVADTGNACIRKITSGGVVTTFAGLPTYLGSADGTGTSATFWQPSGVAIDTASNLYVVDYFNNTVRQVSPAGTVMTMAGLAGTVGSADGAGSSARFRGPQGVAVTSADTVFVADSGNSTIRMMNASGVVTTFAGSPSIGSSNGVPSASRFYAPKNIAVDSSSNVFVADTLNSVIRKITPAGAVSVFAGSVGVFGSADGPAASALFSGPQGIAVDTSGNVFVADTGNSTIRKITSGGTVSTLAGSPGNPGNADGTNSTVQFYNPEGVAVDGSDNVYVADTWNHTIRKITSNGVSSTLAGLAGTFGTFDGMGTAARFNGPTGVAVDTSGNVYVADYNNNTIREVSSGGAVSTIIGWAGVWGSSNGVGSNALFFNPAGISVDASDNLWVVDGNNTLRKATASGTNWTVTTVAGLAGVAGSSDGIGAAAEFFNPGGVAASSAGYIYVADSGNNTIRSQGIPPLIVTEPQSQSALAGTSVTMSVAAYGSSPFTYTWTYNSTNLGSNLGSSIAVSNAGSYQVTVSNIPGNQLSTVATLVLTNPPVSSPGVFQAISVGSNGTVLLSLSGSTNATYTLEVSTNLITWSPLATFTMTNGAVQYNDTTSTNFPVRYYLLEAP